MIGTIDKPGRIGVIELMRGLASISVGLFHFGGQLSGVLPEFFQRFGWLGVDVFFVISGFVVPLSLVNSGYGIADFPRFLARRLVRLEPPYIASVILVVLLWYASAMVPGFRGDSPDISANQLLFHFFYAIPLTSYQWLNPVYWTLAYEFIFYVLVGFLFVPLMKAHAIWTLIVAILIGGTVFSDGETANYRVFEFLLGVLAMRYVVRRDPPFLTLILCAVATGAILWFGDVPSAVSAAASAAVIVFFVHRRLGPTLLWLGTISYSFYLVHVPVGGRVVNLGKRFGHGEIYDIVVMAIALVVSLIFAAIFFCVIERPAIQLSRRVPITRSTREFSVDERDCS